MQKHFKVIVEKHEDGYIAYPIGLKGVILAQADTYEDALKDIRSAIHFHIETFGSEILDEEDPALEAFVAEAYVSV